MEALRKRPGNPAPVDWSIRFFWRSYQPITEFTVSSSLYVYQCGRRDFPILLRPLLGDGELLPISSATASAIEKFIKSSTGDGEISPGERIKVWRRGARYEFVKKGIGMAIHYMSEIEANLLADVIIEILKSSDVGETK